LRYRLVPTGEDGVREMLSKAAEQERIQRDMASVVGHAGEDGLAAVRHVREHAADFGISADRIGLMGFSAGGTVMAFVTFNSDARSRPDFIAPIYAGLATFGDAEVPDDAPPMFVVAASDDPLGLARDGVALYRKWLAAGKSAEIHIYSRGGHGFGMRRQNLPSDAWIERFGEWLGMHGLLAREPVEASRSV
jgi:acetyl esterase/lipase